MLVAGDELRLPVVVCLNKADLITKDVREEWKLYLEKELNVHAVCSSCKDDGESRREILETLLNLQPFQFSREERLQLDISFCGN